MLLVLYPPSEWRRHWRRLLSDATSTATTMTHRRQSRSVNLDYPVLQRNLTVYRYCKSSNNDTNPNFTWSMRCGFVVQQNRQHIDLTVGFSITPSALSLLTSSILNSSPGSVYIAWNSIATSITWSPSHYNLTSKLRSEYDITGIIRWLWLPCRTAFRQELAVLESSRTCPWPRGQYGMSLPWPFALVLRLKSLALASDYVPLTPTLWISNPRTVSDDFGSGTRFCRVPAHTNHWSQGVQTFSV